MPAWSGLYDGVHGVPYSTIGVENAQRRLRRAVRGVGSRRFNKTILTAVNGTVGSAILGTHTRIMASQEFVGNQGGVRQVEVATDINRNLTAADQAKISLELNDVHTPAFPKEKSGNSGGGKLGF